MKFFFRKNEYGLEVAEEIVVVKETLDVPGMDTEQMEMVSAIAMALWTYIEEKKILLAIQNPVNANSAWSCKSISLRQQPFYQPNLKRK